MFIEFSFFLVAFKNGYSKWNKANFFRGPVRGYIISNIYLILIEYKDNELMEA